MRRLLLITALLAIAACLALPVYSQQPDPKMVERGVKVYQEQKCATCHQIEGKGSKISPLDGVGAKLTEQELRRWLLEPRKIAAEKGITMKPVMPSYEKLPKEDIDALVAYMRTLTKEKEKK
jgi:mono/diheme cytochrome c family protein